MIYNYDSGYLYLLVHEVSLNKDRLRSKYVTVKHKHERFRVIIKCAVVEITILRQGSKPKAIAMNSNCAHLPNVLKKEHTSIETWWNKKTCEGDRRRCSKSLSSSGGQFQIDFFLVMKKEKSYPRKTREREKNVLCAWICEGVNLSLEYHHILVKRLPSTAEKLQNDTTLFHHGRNPRNNITCP